ncbi:MAG: vitamin B12-dependent ribonucleotide reductase [Actinobacteria bacterium]|nr:vitamin B12-dependent ribonucleotide reductase [Actinomycetota bacterium]
MKDFKGIINENDSEQPEMSGQLKQSGQVEQQEQSGQQNLLENLQGRPAINEYYKNKPIELSVNAVKVLEKRYLKRDEEGTLLETPREMFVRVARNIAAAEKNYGSTAEEISEIEKQFFDIISDLDFLPNSPTLMNAGKELQQLAACFVLPVGDSMEKIFEALKETALIQKSGGGVGYSFSHVRPKNDVVLSTKGVSSGPISFMTVFNAATDTIKQGGTRRGANMGILRVDHPDILEFISAKEDSTKLNNFNLSVGVTEAFMRAVENNDDYEIINPRTKEVVSKYNAREIFQKIIYHAWKNGDPGIVFLDRLNRDNPTPHIGVIESTNPCGEQPLLPYEACNLGSINLAHMVKIEDGVSKVDYEKLKRIVHTSVRFLDDVIDMSKYPLEKIIDMAKGNRKIGLGIMGWADMLIQLGIPYNSEQALELAKELMNFIQDESKQASRKLAAGRGSFPNFKGSIYDSPDGYPIRNATTTTIAPTGTLSIIANCSSGVEPVFAISFVKNVMDNTKLIEVNNYFEKNAKDGGYYSKELMEEIAGKGNLEEFEQIPASVKRIFVTAHEISPVWHVRMQASFQEFVDNAVSKTVNFPNSATEKDVEEVYMLAYRLGCKGITIYRDGSRESQVLKVEGWKKKVADDAAGETQKQLSEQGLETEEKTDVKYKADGKSNNKAILKKRPDLEKTYKKYEEKEQEKEKEDAKLRKRIQFSEEKAASEEISALQPQPKIKPRPRPEVTRGMTKKYNIGGCGKLYVTVNADDVDICEVFTNTGEEGCAALSEAVSRLISITIRSGIDIDAILKQVEGIRCVTCIADENTHVLSCPDAIGKAIEFYLRGSNKFDLNIKSGPKSIMICPEEGCGGIMQPEGGCYVCRSCGFSKCS